MDLISREETMETIKVWIEAGMRPSGARVVVTAYSEFYVAAAGDSDFRMALEGADLVVPDGVGPLAAVSYQRSAGNNFFKGLVTGFDILRQGVGETVPGVWLFEEIMKEAAKSHWKIFLLGGYADVAERLVKRFGVEYPGLEIGFDQGMMAVTAEDLVGVQNERIIKKINDFSADVLFVAYGPVKQEKWLMANKARIKVKVAMGVGGTFDELSGKVKPAPEWLSKMGLKWVSRVVQQPKRLGRIWRGVVVFPWKVFRDH